MCDRDFLTFYYTFSIHSGIIVAPEEKFSLVTTATVVVTTIKTVTGRSMYHERA